MVCQIAYPTSQLVDNVMDSTTVAYSGVPQKIGYAYFQDAIDDASEPSFQGFQLCLSLWGCFTVGFYPFQAAKAQREKFGLTGILEVPPSRDLRIHGGSRGCGLLAGSPLGWKPIFHHWMGIKWYKPLPFLPSPAKDIPLGSFHFVSG